MKIKSEIGFTGIDISIAVIVMFIFVSLIATLIYNINSQAKEVELKKEATTIAIDEIEKVKINGFETYETMNKNTEQIGDISLKNQEVEGKPGFYKTTSILDYTEIEGNEGKIPDLVKKITVEISYVFKNKKQTVTLSTILSKEK